MYGKIHPGRWGYDIRDEDGDRAEEVRRKERDGVVKMGISPG